MKRLSRLSKKLEMPIPIHFISGYLGSGKTTMLNCLLSQIVKTGKKIALILNDFGDICVDSSLYVHDGSIHEREQHGGQIFCPCQSSSFVKNIAACCELGPDMILVEPSGLVKPAALLEMLDRLYFGNAAVCFGSFTCVVDPLSFAVLFHTVNAIAEQASVANRFVINKTDLASPSQIADLKKLLASTNPDAEVIETSQGKVSLQWFDRIYAPVDLGSERIRSFATWGEIGRPKPFTIYPPQSITSAALSSFLEHAAPDTLRAKGYVQTSDCGLVLAQIASGRVSVQKSSLPDCKAGLTMIQITSHQAEYEEALGC
ncbi:MAG: GTP-binding protein [Sphaerochaetaceae bacterium]|jgi:G3E family GTPase|nr:GTP-binding protein [Sphaerochaetaceae bacterium]MDD4007773.1 GTP-binding protein [Sphaerochaetaceae bacterium]